MDYLKESEQTQAEFATQVEVSQQAVSKWCSGESVPNTRVMSRIVRATQGRVGPPDFYDIEEQSDSARSEAGALEGGGAGCAGANGHGGDQISSTAGLSDSVDANDRVPA